MRNLVFMAMLLAAASTAGWFSIQRDGDNVSIDINPAEIRGDTKKIIERGREILDHRGQLADQRYGGQSTAGTAPSGQSQPASQSQPSGNWNQQQPAPWAANTAGGQSTTGYPAERGFAGPPPTYNGNGYASPPTYAPTPNYAPSPNYGSPNYAPSPNYGSPNYAPGPAAPYSAPASGYPRQASPYAPQGTYPR